MPNETDSKARTRAPRLRKPDATDGADIWALIQECKPLDENSTYCNLVQAALFVWQVAVSPRARGMGLGRKMLFELLERDACSEATGLKTTITRDNEASWALFRSFARQLGGQLSDEPHFEREAHFDGHHATEHMVTITLPRSQMARAA